MKIAMIMLAAGNSRRFHSNKLLFPVEGVPMYLRTLNCLAAVRDEVSGWTADHFGPMKAGEEAGAESGKLSAGLRRESGSLSAGLRRESGSLSAGLRSESGSFSAGLRRESGSPSAELRPEAGSFSAGLRRESGSLSAGLSPEAGSLSAGLSPEAGSLSAGLSPESGKLSVELTVVTRFREVADAAEKAGCRVLVNPRPEEGISSSLKIGLEANLHKDACLFSVSDQPWLRPETVEGLLALFLDSHRGIACVSHKGKRGNPCIFSRQYYLELLALTGDTGGKRVMLAHPLDTALWEVKDGRELTDLDQMPSAGQIL